MQQIQRSKMLSPRRRICSAVLLPIVLVHCIVVAQADKANCRLEKVGDDFKYSCDDAKNIADMKHLSRFERVPNFSGFVIEQTSETSEATSKPEPTDFTEASANSTKEDVSFPALVYVGEPPYGENLQNCQGDCNTDDQCAFGLSCFKRNGFGTVPGCAGEGVSMLDYCYKPLPGILVVMGDGADNYLEYPLQKCQGECYNDDDCTGDLRCWVRTYYEPVPGCEGFGTRDRNYCYDAADLPTSLPTSSPSESSSVLPQDAKSSLPSNEPSIYSTNMPTSSPTISSSAAPTGTLTLSPSNVLSTSTHSNQPFLTINELPTSDPSDFPSLQLMSVPSGQPSAQLSSVPSESPSVLYSEQSSTDNPLPTITVSSDQPSLHSSTATTMSYEPSVQPSKVRVEQSSTQPSDEPSMVFSEQWSSSPRDVLPSPPSSSVSDEPSLQPSEWPSITSSDISTRIPTSNLSNQPSLVVSEQSSGSPRDVLSSPPSSVVSDQPSLLPSEGSSSPSSNIPTVLAASILSDQPSVQPIKQSSRAPMNAPTKQPSLPSSDTPSLQPSELSSDVPSSQPSIALSNTPSLQSSSNLSDAPSSRLSIFPSDVPSEQQSDAPSRVPSDQPSMLPSNWPSVLPSPSTSDAPSDSPSTSPPFVFEGEGGADDYLAFPSISPGATTNSAQPGILPSDRPHVLSSHSSPDLSDRPSTSPSFVFGGADDRSDYPSTSPADIINGSRDLPTTIPQLSSIPSDYPSITSESPSDLPSSLSSLTVSDASSDRPSNEPSLIFDRVGGEAMPQATLHISVTPSISWESSSDLPSFTPNYAASDQPSDLPSSAPSLMIGGHVRSDIPSLSPEDKSNGLSDRPTSMPRSSSAPLTNPKIVSAFPSDSPSASSNLEITDNPSPSAAPSFKFGGVGARDRSNFPSASPELSSNGSRDLPTLAPQATTKFTVYPSSDSSSPPIPFNSDAISDSPTYEPSHIFGGIDGRPARPSVSPGGVTIRSRDFPSHRPQGTHFSSNYPTSLESKEDSVPTAYSDISSNAPSARILELTSALPTFSSLTCNNARQRLEQCFAVEINDQAVQECDQCVVDLIPPKTTNCGDLESITCGALAFCNCGPCAEPLEVFLACGFEETRGCLMDCDGTPSRLPSATPASSMMSLPSNRPFSSPTVHPTLGPMSCTNAISYLYQCFDAEMDEETSVKCDACVTIAMSSDDDSCGDTEYSVCNAIESCPCSPCEVAIENYLTCGLESSRGCHVDCKSLSAMPSRAPTLLPSDLPSSSPTLGPISCVNAPEYLDQCYQRYYTELGSEICDSCTVDFLPQPGASCSDIESLACEAVAKCPCDLCYAEIENYLTCGFEASAGCSVGCQALIRPSSVPDNHRPTQVPSSSDSGSPSGVRSILSDKPTYIPIITRSAYPSQSPTWEVLHDMTAQANLEACFFTKMDDVSVTACDSCLVNTLPTVTTTCAELNTVVCLAVELCPCADCKDSIATYLNIGFQRAQNCIIDCKNYSASSDNEPSVHPSSGSTSPPKGISSEQPDVPSDTPTVEPTATAFPSALLSDRPSFVPTLLFSDSPSVLPTLKLSDTPSMQPSDRTTDFPTPSPTSLLASDAPSDDPSTTPTVRSTIGLSDIPSLSPSFVSSDSPSLSPTSMLAASDAPSDFPSTTPALPSQYPSSLPDSKPTKAKVVSDAPSDLPSRMPTATSSRPSDLPSRSPTSSLSDPSSPVPSIVQSHFPTFLTSVSPSQLTLSPALSSMSPLNKPSYHPTELVSDTPSKAPTASPLALTSVTPSFLPTSLLNAAGSLSPSALNTEENSNLSSGQPSQLPGQPSPTAVTTANPSTKTTVCMMSSSERKAAIASNLSFISNESAINDSTSPQARALSWISSEDAFFVCPTDQLLFQRYALATLYFSTSGDEWTKCSAKSDSSSCDGDLFLSSSKECAWGGIRCNNEGFVVAINLDKTYLSGSIPEELSSLPYLEELGLDDNLLTGEIPSSLGSLPHLQYLDLDKNMLTGDLPSELFGATSLRVLDLNNNMLAGSISGKIGALKDLYFLQLDFNEMTGTLPSQLGSLTGLQYLGLFGNAFDSQLPTALCGREVMVYANCTVCPTENCCTACLDN
ncbi:hypothetical protein MPSEU_000732100 [Mayamaea pseudoterrestris]|nr:hypothetical protein MPSEU_000732100 [Mayamaea pseudoterrestris]